MLPVLLRHLSVARIGPDRPRTRPYALLADKAYSSRDNRTLLRARRIRTVIPERSDQRRHRYNRGPVGGRPVSFDAGTYRGLLARL